MQKIIGLLSDVELQALIEDMECEAKKEHCKDCRETGKRFDARNLRYSVGWLYGDENTAVCEGCYWNDTKFFRKTVSAGYKNNSEL
jgi:hypothetical protein